MKKLSLILLTMFTFASYSQRTVQNQFSLNILVPSAEYEMRISDQSTIDALLGIGLAYSKSTLEDAEFAIFPQFMGQYRYYYNFNKRESKGLKTSENSANYFAGVGIISSTDALIGNLEYLSKYSAFIGPAWGLQRVYDQGFKLNLNLGAGYGWDDIGNSYISPLIGLQLGWIIR